MNQRRRACRCVVLEGMSWKVEEVLKGKPWSVVEVLEGKVMV